MTSKTNLSQPAFNSLNWNVPLNANFANIDAAFGSTYIFTPVIGGTIAQNTIPAAALVNFRIVISGTASNQEVTVYIPAGITGFWCFVDGVVGGSVLVQTDNVAASPVYLTNGLSSLVGSTGAAMYLIDQNSFILPGTITMFAGPTTFIPGWLVCDGSLLNVNEYPLLYAEIGTYWGGSGGAGGTFNIPDFRNMFLRGATSPTAIGSASYQADTYLNHSHTATSVDSGHDHTYAAPAFSGGATNIAGGSGYINTNYATTPGFANITTTVSTSTTGGTETRPKNYSVQFIIKT